MSKEIRKQIHESNQVTDKFHFVLNFLFSQCLYSVKIKYSTAG